MGSHVRKMNLVKMSRNNVVAAMVIRFILNSNTLAAYSKLNFERFLFSIFNAFSIDKIGKMLMQQISMHQVAMQSIESNQNNCS